MRSSHTLHQGKLMCVCALGLFEFILLIPEK